jgi:GTPase SAR1 family protein
MGIIFIGDRSVGKSTLALNLASPMAERVRVTNATDNDIEMLSNGTKLLPTGIDGIKDPKILKMSVRLLAPVKLQVQLVDTAGEINRIEWQQNPNNTEAWREFKQIAQKSKAVVVVLPPYREIGNRITDQQIIQEHNIPTEIQWCKRFDRWVSFFLNYCPNVDHVVLCINKADLFCDLESEARKLAYKPNGLTMDWVDRHNYITNKYFSPIMPAIANINRNRRGLLVRCFITSINNRTLLELPWIHLASYLI